VVKVKKANDEAKRSRARTGTIHSNSRGDDSEEALAKTTTCSHALPYTARRARDGTAARGGPAPPGVGCGCAGNAGWPLMVDTTTPSPTSRISSDGGGRSASARRHSQAVGKVPTGAPSASRSASKKGGEPSRVQARRQTAFDRRRRRGCSGLARRTPAGRAGKPMDLEVPVCIAFHPPTRKVLVVGARFASTLNTTQPGPPSCRRDGGMVPGRPSDPRPGGRDDPRPPRMIQQPGAPISPRRGTSPQRRPTGSALCSTPPTQQAR